MNDWNIPISILLFDAALLFFAWNWFEEILNIKFTFQLYLAITIAALLWCFYLGSKCYRVTYSLSKDEPGVEHYIEFPVIWM